jgi:hypothetical protein
VNGPEATRSRSQSAFGPRSTGFLWPFILPGFKAPVSRRSFLHLETQDALISSAAAIERIVSPRSARASARSRKSSE